MCIVVHYIVPTMPNRTNDRSSLRNEICKSIKRKTVKTFYKKERLLRRLSLPLSVCARFFFYYFYSILSLKPSSSHNSFIFLPHKECFTSPFDATAKLTNRSEVILIALEAVQLNYRQCIDQIFKFYIEIKEKTYFFFLNLPSVPFYNIF